MKSLQPSFSLFEIVITWIRSLLAAFVNCLGFTVYGIVLPNLFVFLANVIGLLLALYYTMSAVSLLSRIETEETTRKAVVVKGGIIFGMMFWAALGMVCAEVFGSESNEHELTRSTIGWLSALFAVIYYASPLSTMFEVIATKDTSSLHLPMICVNFVNALLWTLYGFYGIQRAPIWLPNFIGVILAAVQLLLVGSFGAAAAAHSGLLSNRVLPEYRPVAEEASRSPGAAFENYRSTGTHVHK